MIAILKVDPQFIIFLLSAHQLRIINLEFYAVLLDLKTVHLGTLVNIWIFSQIPLTLGNVQVLNLNISVVVPLLASDGSQASFN